MPILGTRTRITTSGAFCRSCRNTRKRSRAMHAAAQAPPTPLAWERGRARQIDFALCGTGSRRYASICPLRAARRRKGRPQWSALPQLLHPGADFRATARMIAALDLVISVDTVWLNWAASIGRPAWALLNFAPHFTWLTRRDDSPWYPSARLLRQSAP